jgi:hypothetical protein
MKIGSHYKANFALQGRRLPEMFVTMLRNLQTDDFTIDSDQSFFVVEKREVIAPENDPYGEHYNHCYRVMSSGGDLCWIRVRVLPDQELDRTGYTELNPGWIKEITEES